MATVAIDEYTERLALPLPNGANSARADCERIAEALTLLDEWVAGGGAISQHPALANFPATGAVDVIYLAQNTGRLYRWRVSPVGYVSIGGAASTDEITEGTSKLFFTVARARSAAGIATSATAGLMRVGSGLVVNAEGVVAVSGGGGGEGLPSFNEMVLVPTSNNQTTFTVSGGYTAGVIDLYLNGVRLTGNGVDFTASNGTSIVLTTGITTGDRLLLRRWTTANNLPFAAITDRPTTLAGYGITDASTSAATTAAIAAAVAPKANTSDVTAALTGKEPQLSISATNANTSVADGTHYVVTAAITLTAPASPADGFRFGFTNTSTGTCLVNWAGKSVKGVTPNPQAMIIPSRGTAIVRWSSTANTWLEI